VRLVDYKVRIVDQHARHRSQARVVVESARGAERWNTMAARDIIEASWRRCATA